MKVVLFSELNSKFGAKMLDVLHACDDVTDILVVTRADHVLCSYYSFENDAPNLKRMAAERHLRVVQSESINTDPFRQEVEAFAPDYLMVANYQKKIGTELTETARVAAVNFHPSPLPRYAGLAPFFWMAKNGETRGGVTCCLVAETLDAGDIVDQVPLAMSGSETASEVRDLHFEASFAQLASLLPRFAAKSFTTMPQDLSERTYFGRPTPRDLTIDWKAGVEAILRTVRASLPHPGALACLPNGLHVRVTSADPYPAEPGGRRPGTLENIDGDWVVATVDGRVRINTIACFHGTAEPIDDEEVAVGELVLDRDSLVRSASVYDDVLGHLIRLPLTRAS
jgi:methionyl-tRNA formyltransferase